MTGWQPSQLLPARAVPLPGEAFGSWAARQQELAGFSLTPWVPSSPSRPITPGQLKALARLSGTDPEALRAMTWNDYRAIGIGTRRRQRWLVNARWTCPVCQPRRRSWQKAWETGLCPCCLDCEVLLTHPDQPAGDPVEAPRELVNLSYSLLRRLERSRSSSSVMYRFRRMHRMCCLVAATIDARWPPRPATGLLDDYTACRTWADRPPADPAAVAEVLIATLSDRNPTYQRWLQIEGTQRLSTHTTTPPSRGQRPIRRRQYRTAWEAKASPEAHYPGIGIYTPPVSPRTSQHESLFWHLSRDIQATITAGQIPGLLRLAGDGFMPPPDQWPLRHDLALAIDMLLHTDDSGRPGLLCDAHCHFGEPDAAPSLLLRDLARRQITPVTDATIREALPLLATNPDLGHHRDLLRANTALPVQWHHILPNGTDPALSHGWIWCYLTGDDLRSAPPWAKPAGWFPTRAIWDFHHSLDATTLLDMADAADDFLTPHLQADPAQDATADGLLA